jgi:hypothetical protein
MLQYSKFFDFLARNSHDSRAFVMKKSLRKSKSLGLHLALITVFVLIICNCLLAIFPMLFVSVASHWTLLELTTSG